MSCAASCRSRCPDSATSTATSSPTTAASPSSTRACRARRRSSSSSARPRRGGHPDRAGAHGRRHPQPPRPLRRLRLDPRRDGRRHRHPRAIPHDLGPRRAARPRRRGRRRAPPPVGPAAVGRSGLPVLFKRRMRMRAAARFPRLFKTPMPTSRLDDAQVIRLGGREWIALHTPGHTEDHLCLLDPAGGVMLSGDHVLPTITPHIGGLNPNGDPLLAFFESLDKVAAYGPTCPIVLPAHGHPFDDLAGRAKAIQAHHAERLDRLRQAAEELGRPATGARAVGAPVLAAGAGADGRQRDVRPPRAPPPRRRDGAPRAPADRVGCTRLRTG